MKIALQKIPHKGHPLDILNDAGDGPRLFDHPQQALDWLGRQEPPVDVKNWQIQFIFEPGEKALAQ